MIGRHASLVLRNGRVATPEAVGGYAQAIAVDGERIGVIGSDSDVRPLIGPRTRVVDLAGRLAIPAFGDAHVHPVAAGLEYLRCDLYGTRTADECLTRVATYAQGLPAGRWVMGGGWSLETFGAAGPPAGSLDVVCGGRPAFLAECGHHTAWVSGAALALAGIDRHTPDPPDGRIERDPAGAPTGTLHDGAMRLVGDLLPAPGIDQLVEALLFAQRHLHALGITRWQDAAVGAAGEIGVPDTFDAYRRAAADGVLTAQVVGALWWDRRRGLDQLPHLLGRREAASSGAFRATAVKIMVDGVVETQTAAMGDPYLSNGKPHAAHHCGDLFIDPPELAAAVAGLDAEGFQVHFHALGDRAVTIALDALAGLRAPSMRRHHLAHLQFIRPTDLDRFAELGVVANFQPLWACNNALTVDLTLPLVDPERQAWSYRIGSLAARGVPLAFGSDWPVSSPDPLQQIHVAVNRRLSTHLGRAGAAETERPFLPAEAINVTQAVTAFTAGTAFVNHDDDTGVLATGWRADVVVLDQDIFACPPVGIGDTSVVLTVAGGQVVHGKG